MKRIALAFAMLFCGLQQTQAAFVSISADPAGPLALSPSNTSVALAAYSDTYSVAVNTPTVVFLQNALITVGNSGTLNTVINFALTRDITVNGDTQSIQTTGTAMITPSMDTFTFDPLGPVAFGNVLVNFFGGQVQITQFGTYELALWAEVTVDDINVVVPEPASMAMWGFGALGLTLAARRKSRKTESAC